MQERYRPHEFEDEIVERRQLFDTWMHDGGCNFNIIRPSDMTIKQVVHADEYILICLEAKSRDCYLAMLIICH